MFSLKWLCFSMARVGDEEGTVRKTTFLSANVFFYFLPSLNKTIADKVSENEKLMKS